MVMPARPFLPQHPDYHPGRRLPWWARPSAAIGHAAWFRALAEVEACSPDRGGHPAPTVWRAYADAVMVAASCLTAGDAGRFTRTQDPA